MAKLSDRKNISDDKLRSFVDLYCPNRFRDVLSNVSLLSETHEIKRTMKWDSENLTLQCSLEIMPK